MTANKGFSLVEILVVASICSILAVSLTSLLTSSRSETAKGSEMIQAQMLIERIVASLRTDVRSLRQLRNISSKGMQILVMNDGRLESITYNLADGVLQRTSSVGTRRLNSPGEIAGLHFEPRPSFEDFQYLEMALMVKTDEAGSNEVIRTTLMTVVSHFFPYCLEDEPLFVRGRR